MKNPLKFLQDVKQEAFKITWPTKKDTVTGSLMVFVLASLAAVFFLLLDQILKFFFKFNSFTRYLNELVYSSGLFRI